MVHLSHNLTFPDLYSRDGLTRLDAAFAAHLVQADAELHARFLDARTTPESLNPKDESLLILALGPHIEDFTAQLFSIEKESRALAESHHALAPLYACKRLFVQRRAAKAVKPEEASTLDGEALLQALSLKPSPSEGEGRVGVGEMGSAVSSNPHPNPPPQRGKEETISPYQPESALTIERAQALRGNPTDAEKHLWRHLRQRQLADCKFRRQHPVGKYIADFACVERQLIIELDGGQHAESAERDAVRTAWLESQGYKVLRFWNHDVLQNTEGVLQGILEHLQSAEDFELTFAKAVMSWLDDEAANKDQLDLAARYAAWALYSAQGRAKHGKGILFQQPAKLDFQHLVHVETEIRDGVTVLKLPESQLRRREGFSLTDAGATLAEALDETHYCIFCAHQGKDSCSKGLREKDGAFKKNPLDITLAGCPLEEKISEMNELKSQGFSIAALATVVIDNPMCAGTGHRICNDCMKSCIYQKQEPVDIPQAETRTLKDVLSLPYGFEIYSLFTRWNPLNFRRPLPRSDTGKKILVAGLGPAGYTLAHHLMNDGHTVVGIDGLKIEPLPPHISGITQSGERVPFEPIKDVTTLYEDLDQRTLAGFGGVAEYGITVRWNKNYLKLIRLLLERREQFRMHGGVRFGSSLTIENSFEMGFDHIALCMGAGKPTTLDIPNGMARGVRTASDFLMALQLTGAAKKDSIANLQLRLPVVVIGGGLTAIDTATESLAYYPVQVEKFLARHEALGAPDLWKGEEKEIAEEFLHHARAIRAERAAAEREGREPRILELLKSWGGVTIAYRKSLTDSPSYRLNHEEVEKALEEGIFFLENATPTAVELDTHGHARALKIVIPAKAGTQGSHDTTLETLGPGLRRDDKVVATLPARAILIAAGTSPNTVLAREDGSIELDGKYFRAIDESGAPVTPERSAKPATPHVLMHQTKDGKAVSFFGDLHPSFAGNVVKAMGSAKQGYAVITRLLSRSAA
ncbi:MAG: DUF559 domain-containing protein [Alphaproteobacteria bacterium]|nr:DUF559 domain-containing protein [Alphaproteobacteria bacterium]